LVADVAGLVSFGASTAASTAAKSSIKTGVNRKIHDRFTHQGGVSLSKKGGKNISK
jgi:hypothetical protein